VDEVARYNRDRWNALVDANALFTRPYLDLTVAAARQWLASDPIIRDVSGSRVLCLASGGGQQSAIFGRLGARVTVLDLAEGQLERDRLAARHHGYPVQTEAGDLRDLGRFAEGSFDLVWQGYSLNFVPDAPGVFAEVARVLRAGGVYRFSCANPFTAGITERDWNGDGYLLRRSYVEGEEISYSDQEWVYRRSGREGEPIQPPREYRHGLGTLVNGLIENGLAIRRLSESVDIHPDPQATPGTWDHFVSVAPPWLTFWTTRLG